MRIEETRPLSVAMKSDGSSIYTGLNGGGYHLFALDGGSTSEHQDGWLPFEVQLAAISPNNKYLALGLENYPYGSPIQGQILIWDLEAKEIYALFQHKTDTWVNSIAFSPDNTTLVTGGSSGYVQIWDIASKSLTMIVEVMTGRNITSLHILNDNSTLIVGAFGKLFFYNVKTGQILKSIYTHKLSIKSMAVSSDQAYLLTVAVEAEVKVWDLNTRKEIASLTEHDGKLMYVAFSPDNSQFATASLEGEVKLWDFSSKTVIKTVVTHQDDALKLMFTNDGSQLISLARDTFQMTNLATDTSRTFVPYHKYLMKFVEKVASQQKIVTGSHDGSIKVWNSETGSLEQTWASTSESSLYSLVLSHSGETVYSGHYDGSVYVRKFSTSQLLQTLNNHTRTVFGLAVTPNDEKLVTAGWDGFIRIIRTSDYQVLGSIETSEVQAIAVSDTHIYSIHDDLTVAAWNIETRENLFRKEAHRTSLVSIDFNKERNLVAVGNVHSEASIWDAATGSRHLTFEPEERGSIEVIKFSDDGKFLITGASTFRMRVWDITDFSNVKLLQTITVGDIETATFSDNSSKLFTAGPSGVITWRASWNTDSQNQFSSPCSASSNYWNPDTQSCATTCPHSLFPSSIASWCMLNCDENKYSVAMTGACVDTCPQGYTAIEEYKTCEEVDQEPSQEPSTEEEPQVEEEETKVEEDENNNNNNEEGTKGTEEEGKNNEEEEEGTPNGGNGGPGSVVTDPSQSDSATKYNITLPIAILSILVHHFM
mmetsp:Transcript_24154/g.27356  ORF Transcript_24154/g.27356 Transcript_24154/m.27356 type:complete len:765 (-) Transcript_24154:74-2368(-)